MSDNVKPCSLCKGTKKVPDGGECPACKGTGEEARAKRVRGGTLAERRSALHAGYARRTFTFDLGSAGPALGLQVRSGGPGAKVDSENVSQLVGFALRYGGTSYDVHDRFGTFSEEMRYGACADTLANDDDVVFMYDHAGLVMGRRSAGTLRLAETVQGLAIEADLDTRQSIARDLSYAIERGDVHQMSVGFSVPEGGDEWNAAGTVRKINRLDLVDVSAVGVPASPTTSIGLADDARSLDIDEFRRVARTLWEMPADERRALSAAGTDTLAEALEALHFADDYAIPVMGLMLELFNETTDKGQEGISEVLGVIDPDGGPADIQPALVEDASATQRQRDLDLIAVRRRRLALSHSSISDDKRIAI